MKGAMGYAEDLYEKALPFMNAAAEELGKLIAETLSSLGDPYLVRARVESHRIKTFSSLQRKATEKYWTIDKALQEATDLESELFLVGIEAAPISVV